MTGLKDMATVNANVTNHVTKRSNAAVGTQRILKILTTTNFAIHAQTIVPRKNVTKKIFHLSRVMVAGTALGLKTARAIKNMPVSLW